MLEVSIKKKLSSYDLDVSFKSESPSLSLLGASGSGKSVTLKCIAGIMKPDYGKIVYNGRIFFDSEKKINIPPQKRSVGYMFQNYALFPDMSVRKNILTGLIKTKDRAEKEKTVEQISELLNITHVLNSKPWSLSGGESQRVALARMLVNKPLLLLFDEPFSALDARLRTELQPEFLSLMKSYGRDYVIVTHSKEEAYHLSERTVILNKGKITEEGVTTEVFSSPSSVTAARLTGCSNISPYKDGVIVDWGIRMNAPEGTIAVGVNDTDFVFSDNGEKIRITGMMSEVESDMILFKYENKNSPVLWMKAPKGTTIPDNPRVSIVKIHSLKTE